MKLLIQSDDYGATTGITYGTIDAIDKGILTCTGMFVNMPSAELAAKLILKYSRICFGLDFNAVTGPCVSDKKLIPHLVDENGFFVKTKRRFTPDELVKYKREICDEIRIEVRAQYNKFLELNGRQPEYLHEHSKGQEPAGYMEAISEISKETGIPFTMEIFERYSVKGMKATLKNSLHGDPYTLDWQFNNNSLNFMKENIGELLENEISFLRAHAGFVDADLLRLSSYNIMRAKDHEMLVSDFLKGWIDKNKIQLISYRDLK